MSYSSILGLLIYSETGMQHSPECMQKDVEYSKAAEHIFLKPYVFIKHRLLLLHFNIMNQEVDHT